MTLTRTERRAQIDATRRLAEELAAEFTEKAAAPGATEADRLNAETAAMILDLARTKVRYLDREEAEAMIAEAEAAADDLTRATYEEIADLIREGQTELTSGPIKEVIDHTVARSEAREAAFLDRQDDHELAMWSEAVENLTLLAHGKLPVIAEGSERQQ